MSVSALTYANHVVYTNIYDQKDTGAIAYNSDGAFQHSQQTRTIKTFSLAPSAGYVTQVLFEAKDGTKVRIHSHIYPDSETSYTCEYYFDIVDRQGNLIDFPAALAHSNPTQVYTNIEYWDESQPGFDVFPFSECVYVSSWVDYYVNSQATIVNDEATVIYPCGWFYWKHSRPPIGGYTDLAGVQTLGEISDSYGSRAVAIVAITDDTGYGQYFGTVDPDDEWHEAGDPPPEPDPSEPGGGDTPTDDDGDPVDFPTLPTTSVISTGLVSLYNPSTTDLRNLAGVLWGNDFEQSIKKVLNDPFDGLISLSMVPFSPSTSGSANCEIGNFDTQISMPLINAQYYTIDCGSITINENWRNALDYNATSAEIFIPFVGFRPLDIQDVMGKTIALKYNVDVLTGAAIAIIKCGNKCLYEYPCNLAYNIPLTGSNRAALYTGLINVAMSGLGGLAAGGAMGMVGGAATSALNVATHAQSNVQRSGSLASNTGVLGEFLPYIVIHRPRQSMPNNFKMIKGYQSNMTATLNSCQGYTEVDYIHLTGIDGATDTELNEIERLLKEGVLI